MSKFNKTIQITDDVRIVASPTDWCVEQRVINKTGKHAGEERWEFNGSYPGPRQAALSLLDGRNAKLLLDDAPERILLTELVAHVDAAARLIVQAVDRAAIPSPGRPYDES